MALSLIHIYARLQATMRSRNIMSTIILQNISQLKALFKDDWEGIIGNADSFIYLGGNEQSTHKYISELLGKETIDTKTSSQSKGRNGSFSQNFQQTGRELMTPDEVRRLDNKDAIVLIRGEKPVIDEKYDICLLYTSALGQIQDMAQKIGGSIERAITPQVRSRNMNRSAR